MSGLLAGAVLCAALLPAIPAWGEGSRNLYPADYSSLGPVASRAHLDLQQAQVYLNRVRRRGFLYVYAEEGEYLLFGSSNVGAGGDVRVFNPQDFGTRGDETIPGSADFTCLGGSVQPGTHFAGNGRGALGTRAAELAGPNAANGGATVTDGFTPCAYQAPETGIYGVLFTAASGNYGITASVDNVVAADESVGAWDVTVRADAASLEDIEGRLFTYAFIGYTAGNTRPVYSTHWYVTEDGYRYRQDLRGLDPNGYALYANTFGFFDDGMPLYKDIRGTNATISNIPAGLSTQPAEYPIFFGDIGPGGAAEGGAEQVLTALGIPLTPPSPQISDVRFEGVLGNGVTTTGVGGVFSFNTTDTVSYQIVVSRDGDDFDPANPQNRLLTGVAYSGFHEVSWNGLDNDLQPFPPSDQAYPYRAYGRNGEVHFPIIDAENNGDRGRSTPILGGGPTIVRLNGTDAGDTRVFFDDRGYVTSRGDAVGNLNGTLCPNAIPAAPDPAVDLDGVDSTTDYRLWQNGSNRNQDCASSAGWGDAKALNLWTYFLTGAVDEVLEIRPTIVDLGTTVNVTDSAEAGDTVQGTFSFTNNGETEAAGVEWSMTLNPGLEDVAFSNLPPGVTADYDPATGLVTFDGAPDTMSPEDDFLGLIFSYTAPEAGPVIVTTTISTTDDDEISENDMATASTGIGAVDVATRVDGLPEQVEAGDTVTGSIVFSNQGSNDAEDVTYSVTIGEPGNVPPDVQFTNLPPGVSVSFDETTGLATLTGMPNTLTVGDVLSLSFSYTAPATGAGDIDVVSVIGTSSNDANPDNDSDQDATAIIFIRVDAQAVCINDAPYLDYTVTPVGFTPVDGVDITFIGADDATALALADQPLTGRILWPEAGVDGNGVGNAWPGWRFENGVWLEVPSTVRPQVTVRLAVNPTEEIVQDYPPATPDCITDPPTDLASVITVSSGPVDPGETVTGIVIFSNLGSTPAGAVDYVLVIGTPGNTPVNVTFPNLPPGVMADYDSSTGIVTFTGLPETLAPGEEIALDFSFPAPLRPNGDLSLRSDIGTSTRETDSLNNPDTTSVAFTRAAPVPQAAPPPAGDAVAVPVGGPWTWLMAGLIGLAGLLRLRRSPEPGVFRA